MQVVEGINRRHKFHNPIGSPSRPCSILGLFGLTYFQIQDNWKCMLLGRLNLHEFEGNDLVLDIFGC